MNTATRDLLAGALTMAAAMGIGRFVYTPILPAMMAETGLSPADGGLIASTNFVGYLLGAVLAAGGWGSGRERLIALSALASNAVLLFAMSVVADAFTFSAIRFLAGIASAFSFIFASTIVFGRLAEAGRAELQSLLFVGVGLGILISSLATAVTYSAGGDWHAGWLVSGSLATLFALCVLGLLGEAPARPGLSLREPPLPRHRALNRAILAYGLFGVGYVVTSTFLIAIARELGRGPLFESGIWMIAGLAAIPSLWFWTLVSRRLSLRHAYVWACLVEAVGVAASVLIPGAAGPLIAAVLLGGTFVAVTALGLLAGRLLSPQAPRRVVAIMTSSFGIGQIIGPLAAGYLTELSGTYLIASLAAAGFLLASAWIMHSAARPASRAISEALATIPPDF